MLDGAGNFYENVFSAFGLSAAVRGDAVNANAGAQTFAVPSTASATSGELAGMPSDEMLRGIAAGSALVSAYRRHGHLAATLDPLGTPPPGDPVARSATYELDAGDDERGAGIGVAREGARRHARRGVAATCATSYSGTIAYEIEHISNVEQREWLREYIEGSMHRRELTPQRKVQVLQRLTKVETMERYFRKQFMSQKTFSIEGLDVMIPMLEETISMLAEDGTQTAVIGMAHRGRLSTIAHVVNRPYEELLAEFEAGAMKTAEPGSDDDDVDRRREVPSRRRRHVRHADRHEDHGRLANNPCHLEAVDGVVEGMTRACRPIAASNIPKFDAQIAAPILIHGDAAFAAPGRGRRSAQPASACRLCDRRHDPHYREQPDRLHDRSDGRALDALRVATWRKASTCRSCTSTPTTSKRASLRCISRSTYRRKFGHDVLIDLIGYRRFGHNEQDEPAYTQPQMYEAIKSHPTVRELFARGSSHRAC